MKGSPEFRQFVPAVLLVLVLSWFTAPAICAEGVSAPKSESLYARALMESILRMEKEWGHLEQSTFGSRIRTDYRHMIVQKDPVITDGLPTVFGEHSVEYLDHGELIRRYKSLQKSYAILKILPLYNEGSRLTIRVAVYWVEADTADHRLHLAFSDWSDVAFQYDCPADNFVITSVKLGGI